MTDVTLQFEVKSGIYVIVSCTLEIYVLGSANSKTICNV